MPANTQAPLGSRASDVAPHTAQYGWVWPNEWPNGEIRAPHDEGACSARDDRGRSRPHRGGRSSNRRDGTSTAAATDAGLLGQLDASLPAGSQRRMIAGSSRQPATRATNGSRRRALANPAPRTSSSRCRPTGSRARPRALCQRPLPSSKQESCPARLLVVRCGGLSIKTRDAPALVREQ
jgi:hypothetical protein